MYISSNDTAWLCSCFTIWIPQTFKKSEEFYFNIRFQIRYMNAAYFDYLNICKSLEMALIVDYILTYFYINNLKSLWLM